MKFGFDIHGVLDDLPDTFVVLTRSLKEAGHEIHILTGSHWTDEIEQYLHEMGVPWHRHFSIADHYRDLGMEPPIRYDELGRPWIPEEFWDSAKAEYCRREGIHLHFDDSPQYEPHFTTPFARIWTKNNRNGRGEKLAKPAI